MRSPFLATGLLLAMTAPALARYIRPDLDNVPVAQIVNNLTRLAKEKPKDAQLRLNLARVHAMAYALKTDTAQIYKGKEERGAWFGFEPKHVPFTPKATDDKAQLEAAAKHLAAALEEYQQAVELAPDNLTARLGLAWVTEQSGKKEAAVKLYRDVIERAWAKEKEMTRAPLGFHSVTGEAGRYLIPLLDKEKDAKEIATLQERAQQLSKLPRPITPLAIPLRDGLKPADLTDPKASVAFDLDGSALPQRWTWVTKDAGWLVYDRNRTGRVTSGLQLFGNVTFWLFWENGYDALASLDDNGDGELRGAELAGLAVWVDANGDGVCDRGELKTLAELGIVALSCRYQTSGDVDCAAHAPAGVMFRDGRTRPTYDLILQRR